MLDHRPSGATANPPGAVATRVAVSDKPYKGPESYQFEDLDLFFGRRRETELFTAMALSRPVSVLHAPSGAGKSSVLNARVIPEIEMASVNCVLVRPQENPLDAVRVGFLMQLVPAVEAEAQSMQDIIDAFPDLEDQPLEDVVEVYDMVSRSEPLRRHLIAPFEVTLTLEDGRVRQGTCLPVFCKLLAGTRSIREFVRHLRSLLEGTDAAAEMQRDEWKRKPLGAYRDLMRSEQAKTAHRNWMCRLDLPEIGFFHFIQNFVQQWSVGQPNYSVCLIVDQFEEIFTRFVDTRATGTKRSARDSRPGSGPVTIPRWDLRDTFLRELARIARWGAQTGLPVRIVISMRDEFLGRLSSVKVLGHMLEQARFRLEFLSRGDARDAIREPAKIYDYRYSDACYQKIVEDLLLEDRYVEPSQIQIVCERIWNELGRELHGEFMARAGQGNGTNEHQAVIELEQFERRTGGTNRILQGYFDRLLDEMDSDEERLEALDMLSQLMTQSGTRNLVERSALLGAPPCNSGLRQRLLARLQKRNIIRVQTRVGSHFAEITHEFLLEPLKQQIGQVGVRYPGEHAYRMALQSLASALEPGDGARAAVGRVPEYVYKTLVQRRNFDRTEWTDTSLELLLRAALCNAGKAQDFNRILERMKPADSEEGHR